MQRRALLVALVSAGAILAFGIGAATIDDLRAPDPVPDGGEPATGTDQPSGGAPPGPGSGNAEPDASGCSNCGPGVSISLTGLLPDIPRTAVLAVAGVGAVLLALLWRRAGSGADGAGVALDREDDGLDARAADDEPGAVAVDDPPATNPVYRAWCELVDRIDDRDPRTTTPGEYAAAARERGYDADAIATLTNLFRRVRYGRAAVTDERADRAERAAERLREESP